MILCCIKEFKLYITTFPLLYCTLRFTEIEHLQKRILIINVQLVRTRTNDSMSDRVDPSIVDNRGCGLNVTYIELQYYTKI